MKKYAQLNSIKCSLNQPHFVILQYVEINNRDISGNTSFYTDRQVINFPMIQNSCYIYKFETSFSCLN